MFIIKYTNKTKRATQLLKFAYYNNRYEEKILFIKFQFIFKNICTDKIWREF